MGVLNFLFEGSPPPSTTTYGSSTENLPQWLSDYTQGLFARANTIAAEPYTPYTGPRIAGFTDDQTNAFDVIRNNIGGWNDEFNASKQATGRAGSVADPYFASAARSTPGAIKEYMDPYVGNVIDRARLEAGRAWDESIMPDISARFIRGGQSGSTAHQEKLQQAGRNVTEGLNSQAMAALSDAYKTAGTQFATDASRQAGIGQARGALELGMGEQMSELAQTEQALRGRDAASLQAVGDTRQQQVQRNLDLAHQDFVSQRDYPRQQADWMSSIIRGMPHDTTTTTTATGPANSYQPSPLSQLLSIYGLYRDMTGNKDSSSSSGGKARGGLATAYAEGGKVRNLSKVASLLEKQMETADPFTPGHPDFLPTLKRGLELGIIDPSEAKAMRARHTAILSRLTDDATLDSNSPMKASQPIKVRKAYGGLACLER